ncbi:MAG: hypothetical protein FJ038_03895 [Chloroflexi bacterium]|nr:hypothetical protein [Chloroflexota bacterium]
MPRYAKPGTPKRGKAPQREGNPGGRAYANRTDLMAEGAVNGGGPGNHKQPVRVPTGQPYGQAQALEQSQQAAPLPQAPPPPPGRYIEGTRTPQAAVAYRPPNLGLNGPTTRPDEPITAGVPVGPGPGPHREYFSTAAMYRVLARATGNPAMSRLADLAEIQGF